MKIKLLLTGLIFLNFGPIFSQYSIQNSMEKYWSLRNRLRDSFIVVSPIVDQNGTNLPAEMYCFDNGQKGPHWGEDILGSQYTYYLAMLATEYKLLKQTGKDYKVTLAELIYALFALERLDMFSEPYLFQFHDLWDKKQPELLAEFRAHPIQGETPEMSATKEFYRNWLRGRYFTNYQNSFVAMYSNPDPQYWNGFFLRDDINENFYDNYGVKFGLPENLNYDKVESREEDELVENKNGFHTEGLGLFNNINREDGNEKYLEASQDNLHGLLLGLSLISKLVATEQFNDSDIPIEFESFFMEGPRYAGSAPKFSILDKLTECGAYKRENGRITVNFNAWTQNITTRLFNVYYHPNGVIRKADIKTPWWVYCGFLVKPFLTGEYLYLVEKSERFLEKAKWGLYNRVSGEWTYKGSGIVNKGEFDWCSGDLIYGYGFQKSAEEIIGRDLDVSYMQGKALAEDLFVGLFKGLPNKDRIDNLFLEMGANLIPMFNDGEALYRIRTLGALSNIDGSYTFDDLMKHMDHWEGTLACEHLPLVYSLLYGSEYSSLTHQNFIRSSFDYFDILNKATVFPQSTGIKEFQSLNRLFDYGRSKFFSNYSCNGIDYMLLNNLVLLGLDKIMSSTPGAILDINDLQGKDKVVFYGNDLVVNSANNHSKPIRIYSKNSIKLEPGTCISALGRGLVSFKAEIIDLSETALRSEIHLPPGFDNPIFKSSKMDVELKTASNIIESNTITIKCFPNPAKSNIKFQATKNIFIEEISIFDITGRSVIQLNDFDLTEYIDVSGLEEGMYSVICKDSNGNSYKMKFVKC